ncbi:MAG: AraC family ligand binding domain-containing protein [Anaerolineae bacterium]|nr:AraC family ligand binding domain-containing protein [Anaerolineae bacterium]
MTDYAKIIRPTTGIQIIEDITNQFGIDTLEGKIGPLIQGEGSRAHFIEMPAGLYTAEHPHDTESIIYTVHGRWVLCIEGKRQVMEPGSLFWFGPNIPTGYEIPFDDPAFILIFKGQAGGPWSEFIDYLENAMQPHLAEQQASGAEVFRLQELPADHPARLFAEGLNLVRA